MVTKFLDLLYHSIVPRKPGAPKVESGPEYDVHYQKPLGPLVGAGKYMSGQFNNYCSEVGAQITVTMDPSDHQRLFAIKNVSDHDIKVDYHNGTNKIIGPGGWVISIIKIDLMSHDPWHGIPRLTALPNGNR